MLKGLRPRTLARIDDEEEKVDAGRAGNHVAYEALVTRHVDERQPATVREVERRVAEVDRDPARLLLGEPVGVLPGQRPDEPGLAVVDVTRRPYCDRHPFTARRRLLDLLVGERAAVEQERAVAHDSDHRRVGPRAAARQASPRGRTRSS